MLTDLSLAIAVLRADSRPSDRSEPMCGIAGLHIKNPALEPQLGALVTPIVEHLTSRGPDSAGIALYDDGLTESQLRFSLRAPSATYDWEALAAAVQARTDATTTARSQGDVGLVVTQAHEKLFLGCLDELDPAIVTVGVGQAMTIYKDVGLPRDICDRYGIPAAGGYQAVGHTRMATESAVTTEHSHPFNPTPDLTLVHNGSFSNHNTVRRRLMDRGIEFDTDNDTEVCARYIGVRLADGDDLAEALRRLEKEFDGFFTLLVATRTEFAVVRDSFACKPLVVADHPDYVAVASEYQALSDLPGITDARVFEPMPEDVHSWMR
jgi:methylamine---glutamate N-methyltransferase subunit A